MGKKTKVGKARKDKFYRLAKETGYRSRAAFKLIQLNRKFAFLEQARVVVDLCAAPGGWLQVAAENTPVSSLILGVDLVSIRPIPRCLSFQADITTEKCKQTLQQELKTWKADVFLNDGAPNVGKNWIHDAYQQAELTLYAVKLAADFLRKGGWFVTKIFRSKDYYSLMWVLQQLFTHVHATKPQASRNESAEIFVVCQGYLAPDKIDPKFLNPKFVFKDVEQTPKQVTDLLHPEKMRRHREGYADGDYTLFHVLKASEFLAADNFLELLAGANQVVLDEKWISAHKLTDTEIKECLKDVKVLGKKDIKNVLTWRRRLRELETVDKAAQEKTTPSIPSNAVEEGDEEGDVEQQLQHLQQEERKALKRKLKKTRQVKSKLRHRMDLKMDNPNDRFDITDDIDLFDLKKIRNNKHLAAVDDVDEEEELEWEEETAGPPTNQRIVSYDRFLHKHLDLDEASEEEYQSDPELTDHMQEEDSVDTHNDSDKNPLLVDLQRAYEKKQTKVKTWFSKSTFATIDNEADEDAELDKVAHRHTSRGGQITGEAAVAGEESDGSETDSSSDSDYDISAMQAKPHQPLNTNSSKSLNKESFEIVSAKDTLRLDAVGLALGSALVQSRKRRREMIDSAYHRFTFDDDGLPEWFMKDEKKHSRAQLPVTKGDVQEYRDKLKAIDAKPIKKIAEAKARKKRKELKRLERARKRAEAITETSEVSEKEKWQQIKQVYKKAGLLSKKKKEVSYVVAKRNMGKRVQRPAGVAGPYRLVDKRLKKDKRANKRSESHKGGRKTRQKKTKGSR